MAIDGKLPEKMEFFQHGSHIEIVRKWFDRSFLIVAIFAMVPNWFVFQDFAKPGTFERLMNAPFPFNLLDAIFPAAGAALMYYALAGLLNRTRISVSREKIMVRHGPLPWPGNTELETGNLKRLYIKVKVGPNTPSEVHALTQSGKTLKLVGGLAMTSLQASYLKQEIARYLGIKDVPPVGIDGETEGKLAFSLRGTELEIVRRWFNDRTVGMTVFAVIWNGIAFFFFAKMSSHWAAAENLSLFHLVLSVFPSVGIFLAYRAASEWLNRTWIVLDPEYVSVRHGPLPWPGNVKVAVAQIKRLHTDVSRWVTGKGQYRRYTYNVLAERHDGKSMKLAGGFESASQAMRVAQEMAKYLGLEPGQGAPQSVPAPDDRDTYIETALKSAQQGRQAVTEPRDPETDIQSVLAIWLFIILWNGVIWSVALLLWDSPRLKNAEVGLVFFAFFALIGFGLIWLAIPSTWRFFRQKSTARPGTATRKSSWAAVICMLVIAGGFILILMQALKAPDRTPLTDIQVLEAQEQHKAQWIREYRTQMGEPQPATFFEGTWRRHGRLSQDDVRRVSIRSNGGGLSMRVWYDCIYRGPACDAGEVPAVLTARPDGLIESLSAKLPVPKNRIWLWMSSGKYSYQPAVIGTSFAGPVGILVRENPAAPLAEYVGEWGRPAPKEIGDFTRLTVRQTGTQALAIHVWALCDDRRECDLGEKPAQMELEADGLLREAKVVFETKYGELTIILEPPYQGRFDAHGILHKESKSTSTTSTVRVALTRGHPH